MSTEYDCLSERVTQAELAIIIILFLLFIKDYRKINNISDNSSNNPSKNSNPNNNSNTNTNNITIFTREHL